MKKLQKHRLGVQVLFLILSIAAFVVNLKIFMLGIVISTLLVGTFYCGWVCPYGFLQDIFSKLSRLLGIKKRKMPRSIQKIMVFSRYIVLILFVSISTDLILNIMGLDPRTNFNRVLTGNAITIGSIAVLCFFLLISLFFDRPFCNYVCSDGARLGILSSLRLFTIKRNKSVCINCNKCNHSCPMNIEVSKCSNLRSLQCINCFQCISDCPVEGSLSYGRISITKKVKYVSIIFGVLVIMAGFIVYKNFDKLKANNMGQAETASPNASAADRGINAEGVEDGVYEGTAKGFKGSITVEVTVKDQQMVKIEILKHSEDIMWFTQSNPVIPDKIVEAQSTDISLVSGATYSSAGIRDAVKNALEKAK